MARLIAKYQSIYLFIITLSIIGFITGLFYYKVQDSITKNEIRENVNMEETLENGFNNIGKRAKVIGGILICSLTVVLAFFNIFKCFTMPFEMGFIYSIIKVYKWKFVLLYLGVYYIITYFFTLILIRISISISINIVKLIIFRDRKIVSYIKRQVLKYLVVSGILLFYEFIIMIFSYNINLYLMTFIGS